MPKNCRLENPPPNGVTGLADQIDYIEGKKEKRMSAKPAQVNPAESKARAEKQKRAKTARKAQRK